MHVFTKTEGPESKTICLLCCPNAGNICFLSAWRGSRDSRLGSAEGRGGGGGEEGDKVRMELSLCFESAITKIKGKNNSDWAGVR